MSFQRFAQFTGYLGLRLLICIVQALPVETSHSATVSLAWLFDSVLRIRRRVIDDNLRHAYPDLAPLARRRLARQMWEHLFLLVVEVALVPRKLHRTNWRDYFVLCDPGTLMRSLLDEHPVALVTAHFGNFEIAGYFLGLLGFPTHTVARTLDNPYLDRFVNRFRGATGQFIIPKQGGYDQILRVLAAGGTMAFLADQYAGTKGCWVEFFGRPASAHKAIGLLALEHHTWMAVGHARRLGRPLRYELRLDGLLHPDEVSAMPGGVRELTQWYTSCIETAVRRSPEQYWWLHRRWKDHRPAKRKRATPQTTATVPPQSEAA
ncbi:MAG: lysophospholipid acyltransferase family protein [Pirellulales bacterium]|nr:lysophospholipid acyltransferase family protein [Pirellulales bacterium]